MIPDSAFSSSSDSIPHNYSAAKALIPKGEEGEWCAHYTDNQQWIQAKLNYSKNGNRIRVKVLEAYSEESWVKSYQINTSADGLNWKTFMAKVNQRLQ